MSHHVYLSPVNEKRDVRSLIHMRKYSYKWGSELLSGLCDYNIITCLYGCSKVAKDLAIDNVGTLSEGINKSSDCLCNQMMQPLCIESFMGLAGP